MTDAPSRRPGRHARLGAGKSLLKGSSMPLIFSTHALHPLATQRLAGAGELMVASSLAPDVLIDEAREAAVVIVRANLPPALFEAAPNLRLAARHGAGLDMIPVEAATAAGVLVSNVPGANARTVAEHVFFAALALLRRFRMMDRDLRRDGWLAGRAHAELTGELAGRSLGLVGFGNIGRQIAAIGQGFGLDISAYSPSGRGYPEGVRFAELDGLVAASDIVVLCCPLTPQTRGLIDRRRIGLMKPHALLINVARGAVVDDEALIEALAGGRIGGAALDVFSEQPLPSDHPYFGFDNVLITPHMAGITEESMARMGVGAADEVVRVLSGGLPANLCNPEALPAYRKRFP